MFVLLSLWLAYHTIVISRVNGLHMYLYILLYFLIFVAFKTKSVFLFYVFFEARIIPISLIILWYGYQPEKLQASLYLVLYTVFGSLPLLLYLLMGKQQFITIWITLPVTLGFIIKTPSYMLHLWLPKAHVEAPVGGSMALAGILLKLGSYGLILFLPSIIMNIVLLFYLSLALLGSIYCALMCVRQCDIKISIAYSSVVHMGVVSIGLLRGTTVGYSCAIMIVVGHGICSPMLFALANWMYSSSKSRLMMNNSGTNPIVMVLLITLISINMGMPPRLNLWSEVIIVMCCVYLINYSIFLLFFIFFLGVLYNLYIYTICAHAKHMQMKLEQIRYWPIWQTFYLSYTSLLYLDMF